jgi:hypothetical protein
MKARQLSSTAYPINFLMVLSTDHLTGATGKTVTVTLSKNGAGFGAPSGAVTELENGWYSLAGNATDRATLGELLLHATASGCDTVDDKYEVVTIDPFAANMGIAAVTLAADQAVNTTKFGGTTVTGRDLGASVLLSAGTGTGQLDFTSGVVKANLAQILGTAITETAGQIAAGFKKLFDVASPVFTLASLNQTGDSYARLGAPAGASHAADVAAVKTDTAAVKTQTDKLAFTVANQIDANVIDWKGAAAPAMTGDAYARIGAAGAGLTALGDTRIANLDAAVTSRLAPTVAARTLDVSATGEAGLDFDNIKDASGAHTLTNITVPIVTTTATATNLTNAPTNGDFTATMKTSIGTAVAASAVASVTAGVTVTTNNDKTGYALSTAGIKAIWDQLMSALTTVGSVGKLLGDNLNATVGSRSTFAPASDVVAHVTLVDTTTDLTNGPAFTLDAAAGNKIADYVLRRSLVTAEASADGDVLSFRSLLGAVAKLVNKVSITGATLTVTKTNDTTALGTQTVTSDPAADPITGADTV